MEMPWRSAKRNMSSCQSESEGLENGSIGAVLEGLGWIRARPAISSRSSVKPKPEQWEQAPSGLLKEKRCGSGTPVLASAVRAGEAVVEPAAFLRVHVEEAELAATDGERLLDRVQQSSARASRSGVSVMRKRSTTTKSSPRASSLGLDRRRSPACPLLEVEDLGVALGLCARSTRWKPCSLQNLKEASQERPRVAAAAFLEAFFVLPGFFWVFFFPCAPRPRPQALGAEHGRHDQRFARREPFHGPFQDRSGRPAFVTSLPQSTQYVRPTLAKRTRR